MNEKLKSEFAIHERISVNCFSLLGTREELLKKDVSKMTIEEWEQTLHQMFISLNRRADALIAAHDVFVRYFQYVKAQGGSINEELLTYVPQPYQYVTPLVACGADPEQKIQYFMPEEITELAKAVSPRHGYLLHAVYEGIEPNDLSVMVGLNEDMFRPDVNEIVDGDRAWRISDATVAAIQRSMNTRYIDKWSPTSGSWKTMFFVDGQYAFPVKPNVRKMNDSAWGSSTVRSSLNRIREVLSLPSLTLNNLILSGFMDGLLSVFPALQTEGEITVQHLEYPDTRRLCERYGITLTSHGAFFKRKKQMNDYLKVFRYKKELYTNNAE